MNMIFPPLKVGVLCCAVGVFLSQSSQAGPTATFQDKGSKNEPNLTDTDGFPGFGNYGWAGPWSIVVQNNLIELDAWVTDENPFDGESGDYLQMMYLRGGGDAGSRGGVAREISNDASVGGIDPQLPYEVTFQLRIDEASEGFSKITDQLIFTESEELPAGNAGSHGRWSFLYRGSNTPQGGTGGVWVAFLGPNADKPILDFSPEGFTLQPNMVCDVVVSVDPSQKTWDVEISCEGFVFRASDAQDGMPIEMRGDPQPMDPKFLSFRASRLGEGATLLWSIDNVEVSQ